ncbi:MAG: FAD-dependent oxidoreductase [Kurthia sp.]|nr:FAD-dependent oxidoreductase [Candidatus Kurthia equi]
MRKKAIIIGGGLGGLATALTLSKQYEVHIFEKNASLGGKMKVIDIDGFHFDFGPNTLTMPHYFWRVIEPFCSNPKEKLPFRHIPNATHHQIGAHEVVFTIDEAEMKAQLRKMDEQSAENYPAFLMEIKRLFRLSEETFLRKTFFKKSDYLSLQLAGDLLKAHPFQTLHTFLETYFPHPEVQKLFERFATYIGSSPYATPATFAMIAYFELVEGTYYLPGGATKIAEVFTELLHQQNVHIHTTEAVEQLATDGEKIIGCQTTKGLYFADIFICNGDYDLFQPLLGRRVPYHELSTSGYVELIGLKQPVPLHHHNVWFSSNYKQEFTALRKGHYAPEPTVYSCYPYASDTSHPPALFVLINAPNATASDEQQSIHVTKALEKWGIPLEDIVLRKKLPPSYIEQNFSVRNGAIYGQASNSLKSSFMRPANRDKKYSNLYYVGGTVHPGGGSPIVVKGGYHVAKRILAEIK